MTIKINIHKKVNNLHFKEKCSILDNVPFPYSCIFFFDKNIFFCISDMIFWIKIEGNKINIHKNLDDLNKKKKNVSL
jgi:hypothetical protein